MHSNNYSVHGMHCASCSQIIKTKLAKLPGIKKTNINYASEEAEIEFDSAITSLSTINKELKKFGYSLDNISENIKKIEENKEEDKVGEDGFFFTVPITIFVFLVMIYDIAANNFNFLPSLPLPMAAMNIFMLVSASVIIFGPGRHFLTALGRFFHYGNANMDTLIGLGTAGAYFYSLTLFLFPNIGSRFSLSGHYYFDATIVVIGFVLLGKYLEKKAKRRSGAAIRALISLQPDRAYRQTNDGEEEISIDKIKIGDRLIIKPGMKIPIDGLVISGSSSIDESMISGEAMPAEKNIGDAIIAGTINRQGSIIIRAEKIGSDTVLAKIIEMVKKAQNSRAPIQNLTDKIAAVFVPIVLAIAFISALSWLFFGIPSIGYNQALSAAISSLIGVLVIACPCALGLATPTALMVAIGRGAKNGIFIKNAEALEKLRQIDTVVMDKTGTISSGKIKVSAIKVLDDKINEDELLSIVAAVEKFSEHPIAKAIIDAAVDKKLNFQSRKIDNFQAESGSGVSAEIDGKKITIKKSSEENDIWLKEKRYQGDTLIDIIIDNKISGRIACSDEIKPEAAAAINDLKKQGLKIIMLTGDHYAAATKIAKQAGIEDVRADVLPADKAGIIEELQKQGHKVAMLGDGINDAPALAQADSGLAMATGTDVAMATAGIVLMKGDLSKAAKAIHLARLTFRTVKENLFWASIYNLVGIPLAAGALYPLFGLTLNPAFAGAAMAFSSVSVVLNSLRLRSKKL
jgi:Cu2+-exporting ATPase/Cu+-exporting ATPase